MRFDKTLSELWILAEHDDKGVQDAVKMAIKLIHELDKENTLLRIKVDKIKEFIRDI